VQYKLVEAAQLEEAKQAFESVTSHVYSVHVARPSSGEAMWSLNHQQDRGLYAKVPAAASPPAPPNPNPNPFNPALLGSPFEPGAVRLWVRVDLGEG
jgi:hypothetical protein